MARRAAGLEPVAGAVLALLVAVVVFTAFGYGDALRRDEAIYAYGGIQLTHGVAPYASIFDPKTPLSTGLAALGAATGAHDGAGDVQAMRIVFFVFACLAVLAIYLAVLKLWGSPPAALVAAAVFVAFRGFAIDALGGPNAKVPGSFFSVLAIALLAGRRWFWGAVCGSLAFLVWQPLGVFAAIALVAAPLAAEPGRRLRALGEAAAGAVVPIVLAVLAFALAGKLAEFAEAAVRFPLVGLSRQPETLLDRLRNIHRVVHAGYGWSAWLLWSGMALLVAVVVVRVVQARGELRALLRDPLVVVVMGTALPLLAFSLKDFEGYPDVYPALPYAALGFGGAVALLEGRIGRRAGRRAVLAGCLVATAALAAAGWKTQADFKPPAGGTLAAQRASAATIARVLRPGQTLYALGDPTPLVLTRRRNPDRFIYLGSGVAKWKLRHTAGGLAGWKRQILAARPGMVIVAGWHGPCRSLMSAWLQTRFQRVSIGFWHAFVTRAVRERARREGIDLPLRPRAPDPGPRFCPGATGARAGRRPGNPRPRRAIA